MLRKNQDNSNNQDNQDNTGESNLFSSLEHYQFYNPYSPIQIQNSILPHDNDNQQGLNAQLEQAQEKISAMEIELQKMKKELEAKEQTLKSKEAENAQLKSVIGYYTHIQAETIRINLMMPPVLAQGPSMNNTNNGNNNNNTNINNNNGNANFHSNVNPIVNLNNADLTNMSSQSAQNRNPVRNVINNYRKHSNGKNKITFYDMSDPSNYKQLSGSAHETVSKKNSQ